VAHRLLRPAPPAQTASCAPPRPPPPAGPPPGGHRCVGGAGCTPGTPLRQVPAGDLDWTFVDPAGASTTSAYPAGYLEDPARWWSELAERDIATYSALSAAVDLGWWSWWHRHQPAPGTGRPYEGTVPVCCGRPMHLVPVGWRCRASGIVYTAEVAA
jgi:hypothetical protein